VLAAVAQAHRLATAASTRPARRPTTTRTTTTSTMTSTDTTAFALLAVDLGIHQRLQILFVCMGVCMCVHLRA
jgi:energy-coupling factor transporter transmembrane protein EcfT